MPTARFAGWDPHGVDDLAKPCYDYKGISGALGFLRGTQRGPGPTGLGRLSKRSRRRELSVRSELPVLRRPDHGRPLHVFPDDGRRARPALWRDATFMAKPFATRTGSGAHMHYHLADASSGATCFSTRPTREVLACPRLPIISSAAFWRMRRPSAQSPHPPSTVTSDCRWVRP